MKKVLLLFVLLLAGSTLTGCETENINDDENQIEATKQGDSINPGSDESDDDEDDDNGED